MKIKDLICSVGNSGYYNWDLAGLKAGGQPDGFAFVGDPVTPGFTTLVQPGEILSIMLILDDGQVAFGDCMDVILSGAAGRDPLFRAAEHRALVEGELRERLLGAECTAFRSQAEELDQAKYDDRPLHTAIRYGLTQALLHAAALAARETMTEVVAREYECVISPHPIPILSMCPTREREQVDKMILKRADILPHGDFIRVEEDLGPDAHKMSDYVQWLAKRIDHLGGDDYKPTLHIDVYGTLGEFFDMDLDRIADFLGSLERDANAFEATRGNPDHRRDPGRSDRSLRRLEATYSKRWSFGWYYRRRVVQHLRGCEEVCRRRGGRLHPGEGARSRWIEQHHRLAALLQTDRHGSVSRRLGQ